MKRLQKQRWPVGGEETKTGEGPCLNSPRRRASLRHEDVAQGQLRMHLRDFLLCPLQISPHLAGVSHSVLESLPRLGETSLCLLLQVHELAVLRIQLSGAVFTQSAFVDKYMCTLNVDSPCCCSAGTDRTDQKNRHRGFAGQMTYVCA